MDVSKRASMQVEIDALKRARGRVRKEIIILERAVVYAERRGDTAAAEGTQRKLEDYYLLDDLVSGQIDLAQTKKED